MPSSRIGKCAGEAAQLCLAFKQLHAAILGVIPTEVDTRHPGWQVAAQNLGP